MRYFIFVTLFTYYFSVDVYAKNYWSENVSSQTVDPDAKKLNEIFTRIAERLSPAVVNVYTKMKISQKNQFDQRGANPEELFRFFFGNPFEDHFNIPSPREAQALGSGFVINSEGYIVTNSHVVRSGDQIADEIMVKFIGGERDRGFPAEVVGMDPSTDVALIKLKKLKEGLSIAPLGDSDQLKVGHWVVAIGNPYGHSHSVTQGIVSALGRNVEDLRADFIQTSASINLGNSGGPLINLYGEVVGINTAIDPRAQAIGFAIPINRAKSVIRQLIEKGEVERGWIGIGLEDLTPELAEYLKVSVNQGVLVREVFNDEPAAQAGIQVYDVLTKVNDKEIKSSKELAIAIGDTPIGSFAKIDVIRDGKPQSFKVKIAKRKADKEIAKKIDLSNDNVDFSDKIGIVLSALTKDVLKSLSLPQQTQGVLVQMVKPYSAAAQAGIRAKDVITEINKEKIASIQSAKQKIQETLSRGKKQLLFRIQRKEGSAVIFLDLSE